MGVKHNKTSGLDLCRGDVSEIDCAACVIEARQVITFASTAPTTKETFLEMIVLSVLKVQPSNNQIAVMGDKEGGL
ncbi:hypothetical protein SO802_016712 [Lithocarpus litseifolius]|uniref:Gnk2-homologous domain-containing protein n=1 Tax=Lithocarpus litseifolius TaxID=425828 RepID=A0AAW2D2N9_9ROSI